MHVPGYCFRQRRTYNDHVQDDNAVRFAQVEKIEITYTHGITKLKGFGEAAWRTNADVHVLDGHEEIDVGAPWLAAMSPSNAITRIEALVRALSDSQDRPLRSWRLTTRQVWP